jgi:hypothetical protein
LEESRRLPLQDSLAAVVRTVEQWRGDVSQHDDLSLLLVERPEEAS